jgi:heme A synthase
MKEQLYAIHSQMKSQYPIWWKASWICLLTACIFLLISLVDLREVNALNTWYKPAKFCLSVGIYLMTIIWVVDLLNIADQRKRRLIRNISIVILLELALIVIQGARGVASHFNISSIPNVVIFQLMGVLIAINTIFLIWILALYFKKKSKPINIPTHLRNFIRLGLLLLLFSSLIGGAMIGLNRHLVSPDSVAIFHIPILDWKIGQGDLRISHFLGMHGLQLFALGGIAIDTTSKPSKGIVTGLYFLFGMYCISVLGVFLLAMR